MYRSAALDMGSSQGETILGRFAGSGRKSGSMTSAEEVARFEELAVSVKGRAGSARRESLEALDDLEPAALFRLILTFGSESLFSSACLTVRVSLSSCAGSEVVLVEEAWDVQDCQLRGRAVSAGASSASIDGTGEGRASVGAAFDCWSGVAP